MIEQDFFFFGGGGNIINSLMSSPHHLELDFDIKMFFSLQVEKEIMIIINEKIKENNFHVLFRIIIVLLV